MCWSQRLFFILDEGIAHYVLLPMGVLPIQCKCYFFNCPYNKKLVLMDVSNASWAYNKGFKIKYGKCNHLDNDKIWVMQYGHVEHEFHSRCKHCFLVYIVNEPQSNIVFIHTQPSYLNIVYHFYIAYFNKYVIMSTKQSPML